MQLFFGCDGDANTVCGSGLLLVCVCVLKCCVAPTFVAAMSFIPALKQAPFLKSHLERSTCQVKDGVEGNGLLAGMKIVVGDDSTEAVRAISTGKSACS